MALLYCCCGVKVERVFRIVYFRLATTKKPMFNPLEEDVYRSYSTAMKKNCEDLQVTYDKLIKVSEESHSRGYIELVNVLHHLETSIENLTKSIGAIDVFIQDRRR